LISIFSVAVTVKLTGWQLLHQIGMGLASLAVIKCFAVRAVLFLTIGFLISACVSTDENVTEQSGSQSRATVPGEKIPDEGAFTPGSPGSSGTVHW
jgi:hypothetical protein